MWWLYFFNYSNNSSIWKLHMWHWIWSKVIPRKHYTCECACHQRLTNHSLQCNELTHSVILHNTPTWFTYLYTMIQTSLIKTVVTLFTQFVLMITAYHQMKELKLTSLYRMDLMHSVTWIEQEGYMQCLQIWLWALCGITSLLIVQ